MNAKCKDERFNVHLSEMELVTYLFIAATLYVVGWLVSIDSRISKRNITITNAYSFVVGITLISFSIYVSSFKVSDPRLLLVSGIGGAAYFVSLVLYHSSTNILVVAAMCLSSLIVALPNPNQCIPCLAFIAAVYGVAYLLCQPGFVGLLGAGSTTLFSLLACTVLSFVYWCDLIGISTVGRTVLLGIPFALMMTAHPDYLDSKSVWRYVILGIAACGPAVSVLRQRGSAVSQHDNTQQTQIDDIVYTDAIFVVVMVVLLWCFSGGQKAVLGPFYSFERRAIVLTMFATALVFVDAAARDDAAAHADGEESTHLRGHLHAHNSTMIVPILQAAVLGFAAAVMLFAVMSLAIDAVGARNSRRYALNWFVILTAVMAAGLPKYVSSLLKQWIDASPMPFEQIPRLLPDWSAPWLQSTMTTLLFVISTFVARNLSRSTLLLAPFVSEVWQRFRLDRDVAAITINGLPPDDKLVELLEFCDDKGCRITFFVTLQEVQARKAMLKLIAARGHEMGCLGLAGPHFTHEIIADLEDNVRALGELLGRSPSWFRPQDGSRDVSVLRAANAVGLRVALWNICPFDWDAKPVDIRRRILLQLSDVGRGAIVALMGSVPTYLDAPIAAQRPPHHALVSLNTALETLLTANKNISILSLSELAQMEQVS